MTCSNCSGTIERGIKELKGHVEIHAFPHLNDQILPSGIDHISVSLMTNSAEIVFRPNGIPLQGLAAMFVIENLLEIVAESIVEEIEDLGFEAQLRPTTPSDDLYHVRIIVKLFFLCTFET